MLFKIEKSVAISKPIKREMVVEMVDYYRRNRRHGDKNSLKFVHLPLLEVMQLFVDNEIIDALTPDQETKIGKYGVKIYMANHANNPDTCPGQPQYLLSDTVIVCNTHLLTVEQPTVHDVWTDMLDDNVIFGSSAGAGLDKSTICPPDCPNGVKSQMDISTVSDPVLDA